LATTGLVLSSICFFIPWAFLFRWTFRICVWLFLGPWMKLVDIFFVENTDDMTAYERKIKTEADYKKRYELILGESRVRRLLTEYSMKLHDMEKYMFGQVCKSSFYLLNLKRVFTTFFLSFSFLLLTDLNSNLQ